LRFNGSRLALSTFTVLPVRGGTIDRTVAGRAMALAPVVGGLFGVVLGGIAVGLRALHCPGPVTGIVVAGLGVLLTRGLHVDGLADTVDGLGSYADRARALQIMKSPEVGPFGVAAIVLDLLLTAGCVAGMAQARSWPYLLMSLVTATAAGRLAVSWACRRGVPAARPEGLGALVAGTVSAPALALATIGTLAAGALAVPARPWQGELAVILGLLGGGLLRRHATKRLGGVTGDVLGALVEVTAVLCYVVLALG
jgi:adenosylcobinamide-GDP ribazoletransferase